MGGINKKRPSSKTKSKEKAPKQPKEPKRPAAPKEEEQLQVLPQERVAAVRPFWERVQPEERPELLTLDVEELRARAAVLTERYQKLAAAEIADAEAAGEELLPLPVEPTLSEVLEEGLSRLQTDKNTWKVWQWPADDDGKGGAEFYDAESFRNCVEEQHLDPELKALLPKDPPGTRPIEKPAEAALRQRMSDLLSQVHTHNRQLQEEAQQQRRPATRRGGEQLHVRDANVDLITTMLAALEKEHEFLYHAVLFPVTSFVCEVLPEGQRESSRTELFYEDLDRLAPNDVANISEWITEKVDGFSAKLKPEAKDAELEEEEEGIGDVDLFTLVDDGTRLAVNAKWLGHLAERQLGEDGHPRKVGPKEDPHKMGLVLEWVYGTIVSTAEKARDGAKRALGGRMPTARGAHEALVTALADQASWAARTTAAKELLAAMLASRRSAADLAKQYDIRPQPPASEKPDEESRELPDEVIMAMLRREVLLTRAKLHGLCYDQIMGERKLRSLKTQLRQGEPEFDRLKRELEEVKNAPRGLEGTFRSAAEMERHRAAAADAAIEEQLEVQTSFRQHGARLQGIYDKRQRTEVEMAKRDQELKQLQGWRSTVQSLLERFQELVAQQAAAAQAAAANGAVTDTAAAAEQPAKADAEEESAAAAAEEGRSLYDARGNIDTRVFHAELAKQAAAAQTSQQESTLQKLRQHFQRDVRKQLYTDEDDCTFFAWIQRERKTVEERLADGAAALQHLEMALVNTACDDPGAAIGAQLALPLLQERLDKHALDYAMQRAAEAEAAIVKMDEEKRQREAAAKERKVQAKSKVKTKARTEKEKAQAEKEAADAAARAAAEAAVAARLAAAEEEKKQRAEEALIARLEEEAIMEARRKELLSEEGGYWSRRMAAEQAAAEQLAAAQQALIESANMEDLVDGKPERDSKTVSAKQADRQPRRRSSPAPGAEQASGRMAREPEPSRTGSGNFGRKSPPTPRPHAATNGSADRPALPPNKKARGPDGTSQAERPGAASPPLRLEPSGQQRPLQNGHAPAAARRSASGGPAPAEEAAAQPSGQAGSQLLLQPDQQPQPQPQQQQPPQQPQMKQAGIGLLQPGPSSGSGSGRPLPPRAVIIVPPAAAPRAKLAGQASGPQQQQLLFQSQQQQSPARPPPVLVVPPPASAQPSGGSPPPQQVQRPPSAATQQQQQQQQLPNGVHPAGFVQSAGPRLPPRQAQQLSGPRGAPPGSGPPHGGTPPPPPQFFQGPGSPQRVGPGMPPMPPQQQPGGMVGTPPPHMMMQQQFGGPGVPPPHMMPPLPGGVMHAQPGAGPYLMGSPQMGGPPAMSGPPPMNGPPGAFMVPPQLHGGYSAAGPMPPHLSGQPMHPMQQPGRPHLPPDMGPPPPSPGNLPFTPMQMAPDPGYPGHPGPAGMQPGMELPPHSHPGPYPLQGLPQQQHQQQHFMPDPHAPPPPPGTPPLPEDGTPKGVHNRQQMWEAAQRQQHGGGSAPPAPSTPPRSTMLRAAAQPFVPRATAPAFVPGGGASSGGPASSQRSGSPPASEDSAASVTAPEVPPQQPQQQQAAQQPADEHQQTTNIPQQQAPPVPQQQQQSAPRGMGYVPPHLRQQPQQQQQAVQQHPSHEDQKKPSGSAASTGDSLERQWSGSEASSLMAAPAAAYAVPPRQQQQQPQPQQQAGAAPQQPPQHQAALQHASAAPQQQQRLHPPSQSNSAVDLHRMDAAAAAEAERLRHSASQPALGGAMPPRAWSSIAAANSGQGSTGGSGGGVTVPASLRASSHPALGAGGTQQTGQQTTAQQQAARRAGGSMRAASPAGALNPNGVSPGRADSTGSGGASPTRGAAAGGPGSAGVYRAGGVLWDGLQADTLRLKLVRGLTSESGQNNCFLNVIIQSLWHLGCFRGALLAPGRPAPRGPLADRRVMDALVNIFRAFAAAPGELDVPNGEAGGPESPNSDSSTHQGGWAVSPAELREALGALSSGGFGLSDMHDAAEVLGELFACLHRAEAGDTDTSSDPLLPRRVRSAAPPGGGRPGSGPAMAMAASRSAGPDRGNTAASMVLRLFGLEVQVPCPPEDDSKGPGLDQKQKQRPPVKGAPGAAAPLEPGDLAQYWEYCHLVPAKGLRTAYDSLLDGSFEEMLRAADDEEGLLSRAAGGLANGAGAPASAVIKTLLRRPRVFILGIVWETPQAKDDAIASTVAALRTEVDVGAVFQGVPPGPPHRLRCLVAYSGHHYQAYALVEELGRWLLFDDAAIKLVGGWPDVAASMRSCRHQPSLLFYERADP